MQGDPSSPLHPQTRRHLHNTQRLRAAAIREFARHGLHGTKVSNIVAAAHLTQPSFYRTWPSKEAAFEQIVSDTLQGWQDVAAHTMDGSDTLALRARMEQGLERLYSHLVADLELTHMVLRENAKDEDRHAPYIDIYCHAFRRAQARGLISAAPPERLAQMYTALTERFFFARLYTRQATVGATVREVIPLLLPSFTPHEETP